MPAWLLFTLTAIVVIVAGARLARDGDTIAARTGLGATWVGAILVAGATSLPEISTDVAAVRQGNVDLAVGDLFGSSMANMTILALADLFTRQCRLLGESAVNQAMIAALVGNLLGSNCFNMLVLLILDLFDGSAALLAGVDTGVATGALVAVLLMGEVLLDVLNRPERRVWYLEPGPMLTLATYAGGLLIVYRATH
jgi:cation:H+ antiporter